MSRQDIRSFKTGGFNPFFVDSLHIRKEMEKELVPYVDAQRIKEIYFYGAGCSATEQCIIIEDGIKPVFPEARIRVENDLLGAARSLCGHSEGIAGILGTGSNSCFFDGKKITENVPSLGYILGDEGSGAHIGRKLIKEILSLSAPAEIRELFSDKYNYNRVDILTHIYKREFPNRFLASFMKFVSEYIKHPFMNKLVRDAFSDFFDLQILKYPRCNDAPVSFTGSVAFFFADILKEVAAEKGAKIKDIVQSPINGLTEYHLTELEKFNAIKFSSDIQEQDFDV